jgi:hypothetical protein
MTGSDVEPTGARVRGDATPALDADEIIVGSRLAPYVAAALRACFK